MSQRRLAGAAQDAARVASIVLCTVLALCAHARAQSVERIFASGNEAYFHGDVARAEKQYHLLIDAGVHDPDVYFNLALSEARLGNLGKAVLYFERSLWLRPNDETAEQELAAARSALAGRRAERDGEATMQARPPLIEALVRPFSANTLAGLVLVLDVLLFALLLIRKWSRREPLRFGLAIAHSPAFADVARRRRRAAGQGRYVARRRRGGRPARGRGAARGAGRWSPGAASGPRR